MERRLHSARGSILGKPHSSAHANEEIMTYDPTGTGSRWMHPAYRVAAPDIDVGLRQYMLRVYNYMAAGLAISGLVAYFAVATGFYQQIAGTPLIWLVMLAPIGVVLLLSFRIEHMSVASAQAAFWGYAALMGLLPAGVFLVYTCVSVAPVFFSPAST